MINRFGNARPQGRRAPLTAAPSRNPSTKLPPTRTFTASSSGLATPSYAWSFGDGASGTGTPVTHSFTATGNYVVVLTAAGTEGSASSQRTVKCAVKRGVLRCS